MNVSNAQRGTALLPLAPHTLKTLHELGCKLIPIASGKKYPTVPKWREYVATDEDVDRWIADASSVGILTAANPVIDVDVTDPQINGAVRSALSDLMPSPIFRVGRAPKAAIVCSTSQPFNKIIIRLVGADGMPIQNDDGKPAIVEILGDGQQAVIHGIHPATGQPYTYERGDVRGGVELLAQAAASGELPDISAAWVNDTLVPALTASLSPFGITVLAGGTGKNVAQTGSQVDLRAPSIAVLGECVALIPNEADRLEYIGVLAAIKAASGDDTEEGLHIALEWASRWDGYNDPNVVEADYRSLDPPFKLGFSYLASLAGTYGFNDAAFDFKVEAEARTAVDQFNSKYAMVRTISGAVLYIPESGPTELIRTPHWRDLTRNESTAGSDGKRVKVSEQWLASSERRTYAHLVFDPSLPPRTGVPGPHGGQDFNLYPGLALAPSREGSCTLFLEHLYDIVANANEDVYNYVLMWLADVVQNPATLPGTALVLRGAQGAGKSVIGEVFERILGPLHVTLSDPNQLVGQFNSSHEGRLMIQVEEAFFAGNRSNLGRIKHMITAPKIRIERKGIEAYDVGNYARLLITSNEDWVVAAGSGERRFTVLEVSAKRANDLAYHGAMRAQMFDDGGCGRLLDYLLREVTIDKDVIKRPLPTAALRDQQLLTLSAPRHWLLDILMEAAIPGDDHGDGVVRSDMLSQSYESAMKSRGERRPSREGMGRFLKEYGVARARLRDAGGRLQAFKFPPLAEVRARFARDLAVPPDWGDEAEWAGADAVVAGAL